MKTRFERLLFALVDAGVNFVVAGGVAAVMQGVERLTLDIDLSLDFSSPTAERFLGVMKQFGLTPRAPVSPEVLLDPQARRRIVKEKNAVVFTFQDLHDPFWHVDVFLTEELAYARLVERAEEIALAGRKVLVLTKPALLQLKREINPPRPKDLLDIAELERLIGERPDERR